MSDIQPGDLVVCVDASPDEHSLPPLSLLRARAIYRVVATCVLQTTQRPGLRLREIETSPGHHPAYARWRFRKLNDEPDDAKLITRIKNCHPIKDRQDA